MPDTAPEWGSADFPGWLRDQRSARNIGQEKLAAALGVGRKAPQRWETGGGIKYSNYRKVLAYFEAAEPLVEATPAIHDLLQQIKGQLDRVEQALSDVAGAVSDNRQEIARTHATLKASAAIRRLPDDRGEGHRELGQ